MVNKSLDLKLARIHADPGRAKDFILADAKDADMALSIGAPGKSPEAHGGETRYRSLQEFRDIIEQIVEQGFVDIMLMSAHTNEILTIQKRIFDNSPVTPAARTNDTTDIHIVRGSRYPAQASLPFRTATLDHIQCGHLDCDQAELELANGARLVALPGREDTIRSFSAVRLLLIDEAARVPDDLYRAVRPMLAVSNGRLVALSTPFGQRGWFHAEWTGAGPWKRIHIPWKDCPRIRPDFIAEETRALGQHWVDQEYNGLFTALEGLVYPDFTQCVVAANDSSLPTAYCPLPTDRKVGGIDFGWRNPFAAVWGVVDPDDVLWIIGERYGAETPLADHAVYLPRQVTWYADPAGAGDISALRRLGLAVKKGDNAIARGIAQITARLRTGRLKVLASCVHLLEEARHYRYPTAQERHLLGENPIDAHNHALGALRYLIASIDRRPSRSPDPTPTPPACVPIEDDERLWS